MKKYISKHLAEIVLILVIPILTLGFNAFESTSFYQNLIGVKGILDAVEFKLQGLGTNSDPQYNIKPTDKDFTNLWNLIKNNSTNEAIPKYLTPNLIGTLNPVGSPYSDISTTDNKTERLILTPESALVAVSFCNFQPCLNNNNVFIIGNVGDIKNWVQNTEDKWRTTIDSIFAVLSIGFGFIFLISEKRQEKKDSINSSITK
jgi:hypothetical protein